MTGKRAQRDSEADVVLPDSYKTVFLFGGLLLAVFLIELLNPAGRVNQLLLAGEKRMAG